MTDMRTDEVAIPASLPSPAPDNPLEALSWLGDTVEEVAEGLRARGIKGKLGERRSCPLSRYLSRFGWAVAVDISCIMPGQLHLDDDTVWSPILTDFVTRFDNEEIPDLIDNG